MINPHISKNTSILKIAAALLIPTSALISQPAMASYDADTKQVSVVYNDLNLASKKDQKKLTTRINAAVDKVCDIHSTRSIKERLSMKQCKEKAMKNAYKKVSALMAPKNVNVGLANSRIFIVGN